MSHSRRSGSLELFLSLQKMNSSWLLQGERGRKEASENQNAVFPRKPSKFLRVAN